MIAYGRVLVGHSSQVQRRRYNDFGEEYVESILYSSLIPLKAFFIFNQKGEVLISRLYRADLKCGKKRSIADVFRIQVVSNSDVRSPIITLGSTSFFHVRTNNLYIMAVTKNNANAALVFEFCYRFISIAKAYFGKVDEESVKSNFVLIYELIDEIIDFGYPQNSETDTLKAYITTESIRASPAALEESSKITTQATGAISWRRPDVKYKKNEAFVDVVETVNLIMSAKGTVLRADVDGHILMRAYLSGTPECKFGLNDKLVLDASERGMSDAVELDDCQFHQCVRLNEFDTDRTISFVPPDGEFELMKYRCTSNINLPIKVIPSVTEIGTTQVSYIVSVKTNFNPKLSATSVVLRIPTPLNTTIVDCKVQNGKAKYVPAENVIVWKIPRIQGGQECTLSGTAQLTATTHRQAWARPPIDVDFQVLMFTASGLLVRFLKVFEKSNYHSIKWVRYLTKANGGYQIRQYPMFWKFGFHDTSTIDALLDKAEVSLEAILDEDNLLQECKSQNTRLVDYFSRVDVLQRFFGYVSGNIEAEGPSKYKYPYVATEVLCSEIWSIVETCLNNRDRLLAPFWDAVLDRIVTDTKDHNIMASHFAKINAIFLMKKPHEMLSFIQSLPNIVDRILRHIETPAIVDLLVRIIQLDEYASDIGVLEWLSTERLIPRLVELLSPFHPSSTHAVVSELVKGIISMSAPSPGAGITDGLQNGPASNLFARQLAKRENIERLVGFMLDDFSFEMELLEAQKDVTNGPSPKHTEMTSEITAPLPPASPSIPNLDTAISSGTHAISIIIELIRKNNSDYFEPYLFHTIRNRLIQIQQYMHVQSDEGRESLEQAFNDMVNRMGVVHFGPLLEIMCDRLERFQQLLHKPRSANETVPTTLGPLIPLTFERFRICELYAELLHCSNMSLLNRPPEYDNLYDEEGRLKGGLSAMEFLARVIAIGSGTDDQGDMDADEDEMEPAQELPVHSTDLSSLDYSDEDEDMSTGDGASSSEADGMEEIDMSEETHVASPPPVSPREEDSSNEHPSLAVPSAPITFTLPTSESSRQESNRIRSKSRSPSLTNSDRSSIMSRPASAGSRRMRRSGLLETSGYLPIGDKLKQSFTETRVLSALLDLFFFFPWNNFLHSVVYDVLHQILTGRVEHGLNRELTIALFRDARLLYRIVEAQKKNDADSSKPGHVRLGYMGHLTLISEDVIGALDHYPPDLKLLLNQYAPRPDWDEYVSGRYHETKVKDTSLLGGGKPVIAPGTERGAAKWKVDEAEIGPTPLPTINGSEAVCSPEATSQMRGEFRRTNRITRESSADFGAAAPLNHDDEEDNGPPQFASYLAQAMSTHITSSDDNSDEEDEDGGWLAQKFDISDPPITARNHSSDRRPLDPGGLEDPFTPREATSSSSGANAFDDNFAFEDDQFGPFSDTAAAPESNPFSSFTGSAGDMDETSFDDFGDFGEFQAADSDVTASGGSWSFASDTSISSGSDDTEVIDITHSPQDHRTDSQK
ncbi:SIT4 [Sanghuangporus sanghuang]